MKNSSNMDLLTFFGSTLPDRVHISPINLRVSRFVSRPYCDDCLVPLTVRHLLVECPSLTDFRHRYLYRFCSRDSGVYYI
ncbi:hypothetical protein E2C01_065262 [Portunus trituberculatus]|uniref:Uncharacterized protein n=1 Tax=Portunus trituberculatus TaxID=210409 RepID=A0A5B7HMX8_PORTR|nr:hypothetical protein [Portunus trituberculatus]